MAAGSQSVSPQAEEADTEGWRDQVHAPAEALESTRRDLRLAELKNQKMALEPAYYKRLKYAVGSEHYKGEQLELFEQDMATDLAAIEAEQEVMPPELPRVECRHEPAACTCGQCGGPLTPIREEATEQLDIEPGRFFVRCHIRPQYTCRACEIVIAEPATPLSSTAAWPLPAYWSGWSLQNTSAT